MDRLTARGNDGNAYFPRCFETCGGIGCVNAGCNEKFMADVCDRLAAYEDTGLEPNEMPTAVEMANIYAAMRELKTYKDAEEHGNWQFGTWVNGHWVQGSDRCRCTHCGRDFAADNQNCWWWCPQCGAKMDAQGDGEG